MRFTRDLTARGIGSAVVDLTQAEPPRPEPRRRLHGHTKGGAFDVPRRARAAWLKLPLNPNGRPNADVLRPWMNGMDVTRRPADMWFIDFGWTDERSGSRCCSSRRSHIASRALSRSATRTARERYAQVLVAAMSSRARDWAATAQTARGTSSHRESQSTACLLWLPIKTVPDNSLIAIARDDDTTFGILHSRFHELWSLRIGTWLGVGNDPRYTPSTTFETFPFPEGLTPDIPAERLCRRPAGAGDRRGGGGARPAAAGVAEPARPGAPRARGGAGLPRPPAARRRRGRRGAEEAHPDQPLQPAPGLARPRPTPGSTPPSPTPTAGARTGAPAGSTTTRSSPASSPSTRPVNPSGARGFCSYGKPTEKLRETDINCTG